MTTRDRPASSLGARLRAGAGAGGLRLWLCSALAMVGLIGAVYFTANDIYAQDLRSYDASASARAAFCGSAYDVALLKRNGYMGGETPANQPALDDQCRGNAWRSMGAAAFCGLVWLGAVAAAMASTHQGCRTSARRPGPQR